MNEMDTNLTPDATGAAPAAEAAAQPAAGQDATPAAEGGEKLNKLQQFVQDLFGKKEEDAGAEENPAADGDLQAKIDAAVKDARKAWETEQATKEPAAEKMGEGDGQPDLAAENTELKAKLLKQDTLAQLTTDGYPAGLADLLDYKDDKALSASIEKVTGIFQESLAEAIKDKLKGPTPEGLGSSKSTGSAAIQAQIRKNIRG